MTRASSIIRSVAALAVLVAATALAACGAEGTPWTVTASAPAGSEVLIVVAEPDTRPQAIHNPDPGWDTLYSENVKAPFQTSGTTEKSAIKLTVTLKSGPGPVGCNLVFAKGKGGGESAYTGGPSDRAVVCTVYTA